MNLIEHLLPSVKAVHKTIVLPEGHDPRVIAAAIHVKKAGMCEPVVLATPSELATAEAQAGGTLASHEIRCIDYSVSTLTPALAEALYERRKTKGMTIDLAAATLSTNRLFFGNMLLGCGHVDGLVAGSVASTPDMLRAAFTCVGTAKGIAIASSCFIMDLPRPTPSGDNVLIFADCGVNICPTADELVDIAQATAGTCRKLLGKRPKLALLSFSTRGSAKHPLVDKMRIATEKTRARFAALGIEADVDGEIQADAALIPAVAATKNPSGVITGDANVLIFPDLQAGNICCKLTERLAGAMAYGPILQGTGKPVNDLSRGCSVEDIVGVICITICQGLR